MAGEGSTSTRAAGGAAASKPASITPLRRQYLELKRQHPDALLFFRLGDFYETFDADAELAARVLHITLTSREMGRGQRVPMAGVPFHAVESYIARLIAAGHKVAVCEQLDETGQPVGASAKGLRMGPAAERPSSAAMMSREVVRVVTPGTVVEPRMLEARRNNYLCALAAEYAADGYVRFGLAYADVTTGEFAAAELTGAEAAAELARELDRLHPAECLVPEHLGAALPEDAETEERNAAAGRTITPLDAWRFELGTAHETLCRVFRVNSLDGFGCANKPLATRAAGALIAYLEQTHRPLLALLDGLHTYEPGQFVRLDAFTRRNLELVETPAARRTESGSVRPSLLSVLDESRTPMGGRLLRRWLGQPLRALAALRQRHDVVQALVEDAVLRGQVRTALAGISDVERLTNRVRQGTAFPRDLLALRTSLLAAAEARALALETFGGDAPAQDNALVALASAVDPCADVADLIEQAVHEGERGADRKGLATWEDERLIKPGYSTELDDLVRSSADARTWIAGLEAAERERTGIKGLKVGFNRVFGYYLHVSHAYKGEVPAHYIRRQTLTDGERYITPELKEYENLVLHAQERIAELERSLFAQLQKQIAGEAVRLLATAGAVAQLDLLAGFAEVAVRRGYVRPALDDGNALEIAEGRHPVVEAALEAATLQAGQPTSFVPNDCSLSTDGEQIVVLTGPNMAGKSTYLRSAALIVLLAQIGCFVPAATARIGLVDRIFTRVGAQDDLTAGQSTFMVEMVETASILRHATHRSLVILDEIGRGTSTYDGVAIAQAVVEYLHDFPAGGQNGVPGGPRTLFATHYHELAELERRLPRVRNFRVDVLEEGDRVVFLHRVVRGSADRSYGIHVARLAGVPRPVTHRAEQVLAELEATRSTPTANGGTTVGEPAEVLARENGARPSNGMALPGRRVGRAAARASSLQLSLFDPTHPVVEELKGLNVLTMTPLEALNRLADLVKRAKEG